MPRTYAPELLRFLSLLVETETQLGLLNGPPTQAYSAGIPESGAGYSMQTIELSETGHFCAVNPGSITWTATGQWGISPYFGIYDLGGTLLYWGILARPITAKSGDVVSIPPGGAFVDWLNAAPNFNVIVGHLPTQNAFAASTTGTEYAFNSLLQALTSIPDDSMPIPVGPLWLRSRNYNLIGEGGMKFVGGSPEGIFNPLRLQDHTGQFSTGFTVRTPAGLAF